MVALTSEQTQENVRVGLGKVLLVEDEALIRETVALALADEGFEVFAADNGQRALEMLPDNYREVLVLRFFESLSVAETAAAMDCSVANAKVLQFRAMKKLQDIIENRIGWNSADQVG